MIKLTESLLSIGEIARFADIQASKIRFYESIGILPTPMRVNGQRRYTHELLQRIKFIKIAKAAGFSNQEILDLLEGFEQNAPPSVRWKQMAESKRRELEDKMKQIKSMMKILNIGLQCECLSWEECFSKIEPTGACQ